MTVKTKRYIELADVLTLTLTCKGCDTSLTIPISRNLSAMEERMKLDTCPMCLQPWATVNNSTYQPIIADFTTKLRRLAEMLERDPVGFTLAIEVSNDKSETEKP
jgi:hypothetical protein